MFERVVKLSLEDQGRSDKIVAFAQTNTLPIWAAMNQLYDLDTKNRTPEFLEDLTNDIIIADAIYNSLP